MEPDVPVVNAWVLTKGKKQIAVRFWELTGEGILVTCRCEKWRNCRADGRLLSVPTRRLRHGPHLAGGSLLPVRTRRASRDPHPGERDARRRPASRSGAGLERRRSHGACLSATTG